MHDQPSILLVEDNPFDAELTLRALRKGGLSEGVLHAKDGATALEMLFGRAGEVREVRPKLILLDLKLPKVDGIEVLRRLKTDPRMKSIPVVVLTASREERNLAECYALGVNSYIAKPVDFDEFSGLASELHAYWLGLNLQPAFGG